MPINTSVQIIFLTITTVLVYLSITENDVACLREDPDVDKDVTGLIESKGYVVEKYTVQTDDGYLLGTFRIPYGRTQTSRNSQKSAEKPVALLTSTFLADSSEWVLNFPEQSLGFILADSGYDVWLGSARGSTYSQRSVNISTNTKRFWDFSWEEIGTMDLPALVDFILAKTKQEQLFIITQSMGTTTSFVFLSLRPEYNRKVKALLAMSPIANLSHTTSVIRTLLPFRNILYPILDNINHGGAFSLPFVNTITSFFCSFGLIRSTLCNFLVIFGDGAESPYQFNETRLPVYLTHFPAGGSAKQLYHYAQVCAAKQFVRFDYGKSENLRRYGQERPPEYPVEKITVPVSMFWSSEDQLADPTDVATLRVRLSNVTNFYKVPFSPFTHLDYIIGINAYESVYKKLLAILDQY